MPPLPDFVRLRVVYTVPGMDRVRVERDRVYREAAGSRLEMDVYRPADATPGASRPVVILIHGGPVPPGASAKNMGVFLSYGEMLAAAGLGAVTFSHRFYGASALADAAGDVEAAVAYVRSHAEELGIDRDRVALWAFSGGGPFLSQSLRERWPFVRAIVAYYAVLDLQVPAPGAESGITDETRRELSPLHHLATGGEQTPPLLVARAGRDSPWLNATIDRFVQEALARNASLELMTHPAGQHAFDILDDDDRSREIIARTLDFLKRRLSRP
ncbi:MAG: alpha/beta hydrolase [Acidobacteria bacterium]|nr:MAG: alpha/beta hydrolase [Acidobacteriota bacterium]PYQ19335.1 MAG: alpha/beta hydrolase [Acidobacteriota bacterium]